MKLRKIAYSLIVSTLLTSCGGSLPVNDGNAFLARGVSTSSVMISGLSKSSKMGLFSALTSYNAQDPDKEIVEQLLAQFDLILANDNLFHYEVSVSDKEGYKNKEVVSYEDLVGKVTSVSLYYNDTTSRTEIDEDEVEIKTTFSGLAIIDEVSYPFDAVTETEESASEKEKEEEATFKFYTVPSQKTSYIKLEIGQETEASETEIEYEYEIGENGLSTYSYALSVEKDPVSNEDEIELEIGTKEYEVTRYVQAGTTYMQAEIETSTGKTTYTYRKVINDDGTVSYIEVLE